jgi:hypothetical protein
VQVGFITYMVMSAAGCTLARDMRTQDHKSTACSLHSGILASAMICSKVSYTALDSFKNAR